MTNTNRMHSREKLNIEQPVFFRDIFSQQVGEKYIKQIREKFKALTITHTIVKCHLPSHSVRMNELTFTVRVNSIGGEYT